MKDPQLVPGENILFARPNVGLSLFKSGVTFRAIVDIPVLQDVGFFITDRRLILRGELFATLFDRDVSYWLPGHLPDAGSEQVTGVSIGSAEKLGSFLLIDTRTDREPVLRKREAQLQVFLPDAEAALAAVPEPLRRDSAAD